MHGTQVPETESSLAMKKLVIDRSKWFRGNGPGASRLLRPDEQRCCLGFDMSQVGGVGDDLLLHKEYPYTVIGTYPELNGTNCAAGLVQFYPDSEYLFDSTPAARFLSEVNDASIGDGGWSINVPEQFRAEFGDQLRIESEAHREEVLAVAFRSIGREVEFV